MELTQAQFDELRAVGLKATQHDLSGFAEACYNWNSYDEIKNFANAEVDSTDCDEWGITEQQWRDTQKQALETAMYFFG